MYSITHNTRALHQKVSAPGSSAVTAARCTVPSLLRRARRVQAIGGSDGPVSKPEALSTPQRELPPKSAPPLHRFQLFVQAGDYKEAWLSISSSVLQVTLPSALLGALLIGTLWDGAPPGVVSAAEAAAVAGAAVAAVTEIWKILEGFQG